VQVAHKIYNTYNSKQMSNVKCQMIIMLSGMITMLWLS
jgi:hypothetical protein